MGKPSDFLPPHSPASGPTTPLTESSNSISLHPTPGASSTAPFHPQQPPRMQPYYDDDPTEFAGDDLPPLYDDHENDSVPSFIDPLNPSSGVGSGLTIEPFQRNSRTDTVYYVDPRLDSDPKFLEETLTQLSILPPRPFVHILGTHTETRKRSDDDKTEQVRVTDFDLEIELTHLLYTDIRNPQTGCWRTLRGVGNFEKVRRGTVFATRAPGFGGSGGGGTTENGEPTVEEWCHRFCASRSGLKSLSFERRIVGWDWEFLSKKIERLVRDTNYRGHLEVTFPVRNARVEIYNSCRTNRWRLTTWIEVLFMFTLLFVVAWPWLFFRTKRWETVYAEWRMSRDEMDGQGNTRRRYARMSEAQWYNMWARAIQRAALDRRQGQLDQGDLDRADTALTQEREGFVGLVQAGVEAMGVVNRSFGWGGDTDGMMGRRFGGVRIGRGSRH